jgi:hypothetical protein
MTQTIVADASMTALVAALRMYYGDRLHPYGSTFEEEHGFGFTIDGVRAIFSATTMDATLPRDHYDVQIESRPPGDYIYTAQVSLQELLSLISMFAGPESTWPRTK